MEIYRVQTEICEVYFEAKKDAEAFKSHLKVKSELKTIEVLKEVKYCKMQEQCTPSRRDDCFSRVCEENKD